MATPKLFRFFLMKDASTYYGIDNSGAVVEQMQPYPVTSPQGWMETLISWKRNPNYLGIGRIMSTPYEFVRDGAKILRHVYYTYGIEGALRLVVQIRQDADWAYTNFFDGDIDMSTYRDTQYFGVVNIAESGINSLLEANLNTPFEIPVLSSDWVTVRLDGIDVLSQYKWVTGSLDSPIVIGFQASNASNSTQYLFPNVGYIPEEQADYFAAYFRPQSQLQHVGSTGGDLDKYLLKHEVLSAVATVTLQFDIELTAVNVQAPVVLRVLVPDVDGTNNNVATNLVGFQSPNTVSNGNTVRFTQNITTNVTLTPGRILKVRIAAVNNIGNENGPVTFKIYDLQVKVSLTSRLPLSFNHGYFYADVFDKLITKAFGANAVGASPFLRNVGSAAPGVWDLTPQEIIMMPGDAVRGLGDGANNPAKFKITPADFIKDAMRRHAMALSLRNEKLALVPITEVFQNVELFNLGEVKDLEREPYDEALFNLLSVGYREQEYNRLNARDEVNQGQRYKLNYRRAPEEADWISPFRADPYGIEYLRANLSNKTTTDSGSDNDTFMVQVTPLTFNGIYYPSRPQSQASATGLLSPFTYYNLGFSPKRNLLRNSRLLASLMHLRAGGSVTFQDADKNANVVSNLGAGLVSERADIPQSSLPAPLFLPILFKFTAKAPTALLPIMNNNPYGFITFTSDGITLKGFPMDVGIKPANHDTYEFTLLAHPDCDLAALKR